ncbi:hypothetical protein [Elizabethkingia ursingii]|uniref:Uncharacterized protein n=1 Tax=Elizabethkingia ursingii TaxID=1756150 RepID=A0AAJ3NAY6_9FLAO|nr:hypothetical protein [Elizabethkingia ursingii]AQX07906.1 hypothetical protein BBD34_04270 [Elizabethkingia ursingii]OPB73742.1 hypothetical protein BAY32_11955 [Elizabethkingia ursingii]OPB88769.1 hypothetical protein BB021_05170 [Elizabethkingia ursingii]
MKEYYVLAPKSLNLDQRLSKFPPSFEFNKDYCYYFISGLIRELQYFDTYEKTCISTVVRHYVSMCATINQSMFRNSKDHVDYLYKDFPGEGRLLWRKNYEKGKCYSYALPEYFWGDGELELIPIKEQSLIKKIQKINSPTLHNTVKKRFSFTIGYFDIDRFELDTESALNELYKDYLETNNYKKYLSNAIKIIDFKNGEFPFYHNPKTDGRLHTAITSFPKICRKHLKYDGENLVEIDLSSSIPFFLSTILYSPYSTTPMNLSAIVNCGDILYHYMLVESLAKPAIREIAHFRELVLRNRLYEHFMDDFMHLPSFELNFERSFNRSFDGDEDDLRKYSKNRFLSMLFASPTYYQEEQLVFYKHFPTLHDFIKRFKKIKFRDFPKRDWHKKLSYLTFQLESHFMLNTIAREINNIHRRTIPLFTLHDCLIVKESHLETVYNQMQEIFTREIGYAPNMTKKMWV